MARLIALQACRHGIGCSHLVANLAVILMHRGYRVGLLDTDLQVGGMRALFGLEADISSDAQTYWWLSADTCSTKTLQADRYLHGDKPHSQSAGIYLSSLGHYFKQSAPQGQVLPQQYDLEKPYDLLQQLSHELSLDFWLIDNQPELTDENLMGLSLADMVLILLQLDPYDLQRAAVLIEVIEQLEIAKTWLVPSLVLPNIETKVVKHMLENTYEHPVAGILYLTDELAGLASQGIFCLHHPQHPLTQTIIAIAHQLEQDA
ncbi:MAG: AAA family ATPase [Leptolyngbya sp. SIOISBB]|nr:AAA family ATPase [Leptolyngbya sp. SIOISBB]